MKIENFIESFVEELELENISLNLKTNIKDLDEWDSLTGLMLIGFVNNNFDINMNIKDVEEITTVQSLIDRIGLEKFN